MNPKADLVKNVLADLVHEIASVWQ